MSYTLPDIQIGDLWYSEKTHITVLVLDIFDDGEEWVAHFYGIKTMETFRYSLWMIENKRSTYRLISRCRESG